MRCDALWTANHCGLHHLDADPSCRELAAVAWTLAQRRQRRKESSGVVVAGRQRGLETPDAGVVRVDAYRLGRSCLPQRRRRSEDAGNQPASVVRESVERHAPLAAAVGDGQSPGAQAEHVHAVAGDRRLARVGHDGDRDPEGVRLRGSRALGARHPEGLRPVRAELGLRIVAAARRRFALRPGAARHADRRPVVPAAHRQGDRQDRLEGRAPDRRARGIA